MTDFKELSEKYQLESEYNASLNEDKLKHVQALMVFSGIMCQMESDILLYRSKHTNKDKIKPAQERLNNLREVYDHLSGLFESNEKCRLLIKSCHERTAKAEFELEELNTKLKNMEEWNLE